MTGRVFRGAAFPRGPWRTPQGSEAHGKRPDKGEAGRDLAPTEAEAVGSRKPRLDRGRHRPGNASSYQKLEGAMRGTLMVSGSGPLEL